MQVTWYILKKSAAAYLSDLNCRLFVDTQQGNIGDANKGPFLVGPKHDDGASLGGLGRNVEVGKADTAQIRRQTNEDVPEGTRIRD